MSEQPALADPGAAAASEFAELATGEQIATAAAALDRNGVRPLLAATGADAKGLVGSLLAAGAEVYNNTSQTLETTGIADDIERSGRYQPLRLRLYRMDREMQRREMRTLAASPDYVVGSVHALTEGGSLLIASASGSQLGPLASGAGQVILVIGAQKIVRDVATGMRRIYEYCYPLEDARARRAYGVPSGVNNILIISKVMTPGRVTAIIVNERLGFLSPSWRQRREQGGRVVASAADAGWLDPTGNGRYVPADQVADLGVADGPLQAVAQDLEGVGRQTIRQRSQRLLDIPAAIVAGSGLTWPGV